MVRSSMKYWSFCSGGNGDFFVEAIKRNDSYALMGWLMLSGTAVIIANLIADLLYGVANPRIRYGGSVE